MSVLLSMSNTRHLFGLSFRRASSAASDATGSDRRMAVVSIISLFRIFVAFGRRCGVPPHNHTCCPRCTIIHVAHAVRSCTASPRTFLHGGFPHILARRDAVPPTFMRSGRTRVLAQRENANACTAGRRASYLSANLHNFSEILGF